MNDKNSSVFYQNGFKIINVNGLWWVGDSSPISGPFGMIEEARDWCNTYSPKDFETRMFLKTDTK